MAGQRNLNERKCGAASLARLERRGRMESEEYRDRVVEELRGIRTSLYVLAKIALPENGYLSKILDGILEEQFQPHEEPAPQKRRTA